MRVRGLRALREACESLGKGLRLPEPCEACESLEKAL